MARRRTPPQKKLPRAERLYRRAKELGLAARRKHKQYRQRLRYFRKSPRLEELKRSRDRLRLAVSELRDEIRKEDE
jgi:hypothetical protein